jgi:hypothetical protein
MTTYKKRALGSIIMHGGKALVGGLKARMATGYSLSLPLAHHCRTAVGAPHDQSWKTA